MLSFLFRGARTSSHTPRPTPSRRSSCVLGLESLEDRSVPATLTVTTLADSGAGSLRDSIAVAAPGDTVEFAPNLSGTIGLGSDLTLDRNLTIQGRLSAAGNPLVTLTRGGADGSTTLFVIPGVTADVSGLRFTGATEHAVWNR